MRMLSELSCSGASLPSFSHRNSWGLRGGRGGGGQAPPWPPHSIPGEGGDWGVTVGGGGLLLSSVGCMASPCSDLTPPSPREGFGVHGREGAARGGPYTGLPCPSHCSWSFSPSRGYRGCGSIFAVGLSARGARGGERPALPAPPQLWGPPLCVPVPHVPRTVDLQLLRGRPLRVLQGLVVHRAGHLGVVVLLGDAELHPTADGEGFAVGVLHHLRALGCGDRGPLEVTVTAPLQRDGAGTCVKQGGALSPSHRWEQSGVLVWSSTGHIHSPWCPIHPRGASSIPKVPPVPPPALGTHPSAPCCPSSTAAGRRACCRRSGRSAGPSSPHQWAARGQRFGVSGGFLGGEEEEEGRKSTTTS